MVGVGRVAEAEQDGDAGDQQERGAVGEMGDAVVEPEHQVTLGSARAVIAKPRPSTTSALPAGRIRSRPLSKLTLLKSRLAVTARRPIPVIAEARPRLKARIRTRP